MNRIVVRWYKFPSSRLSGSMIHRIREMACGFWGESLSRQDSEEPTGTRSIDPTQHWQEADS